MRIVSSLFLLALGSGVMGAALPAAARADVPQREPVQRVDYEDAAGPVYLSPQNSAQAMAADAPASHESAELRSDPSADSNAFPPNYQGPAAGEGPAAPPAPWTMPQLRCLESLGIVSGGWIEQGVTFNGWHPSDGSNGPLACNDQSDQYELNQLWMYFVRPTHTDGCGWDLGGRIDLCYGSDWRFGRVPGLENHIDNPNDFYGLTIPQFYLEVAYNDLTVKLGHYAACMGYEVVPGPGNFFYSHSYSLCYGQPILLTGGEAEYKVNKQWTLIGGFNDGWQNFEDPNHAYDATGGIKWTSEDDKTSIRFLCDTGKQGPVGSNDQFVYTLVVDRHVSERFHYALEHDLGYQANGNPRTGDNAEWYSLCNYFFYTLNPAWTAGLRFEWFRDNDGSRVAGIGGWTGGTAGWQAAPGFDGNFFEISMGLNWRPHPNFTLRPEVRWDWYDGTRNLANQLPFNDGNNASQVSFATDLIFTF